MASMGAMGAAVTAGMAGMGAAAATTRHVPAVTRALHAVGLGALTHVPNAVLQPLLIVLLLVAIGTALWRARGARTTPALALALLIVAAATGLALCSSNAQRHPSLGCPARCRPRRPGAWVR
jgi:hypothetical protein